MSGKEDELRQVLSQLSKEGGLGDTPTSSVDQVNLDKQINGLSRNEHQFILELFTSVTKSQKESNDHLRVIKSILIFYLVCSIIAIVFAACTALTS